MRAVPVVLAGLLTLGGLAAPAAAQVTTNEGALDALAPRPSSRPAPARPARPATPPPARPSESKPATAAAAAPPKQVKPAIPPTPPAIAAIPPAVAVPLAHPPPPPPIPVADDAPGAATPISNGVRITFGVDRADFSPATADALTRFASGLVEGSTASVNIFAYASGTPEDPSTPRRLSFQRALAARAVLMKAGIPSPRIYPRALGPASAGEPDRADVVVGTATPPSVPAAPTPATAAAPGRAG